MLNSRISGVVPADGALIDALCDEFETAQKSHGAPQIEEFLSRLDGSLKPAAFRELLHVEVEVRRGRGEMVRADDYLQRFPEFQRTVEDACRDSDVMLATESFDPANHPCEAELDTKSRHDTDTGRGKLEVRCPNCHAPMEVAIDTALTDLSCPACGSEFSLVNETNAELAAPLATMGRFELISRLGMGAFGSVWKARDKELDRTVAIKIPRARGTTAEDQEKFFREARAAAQLRHPNIVSVHEVGRDGDSVYIVSDFVGGMTLSDWLADHQPTSREAAELCAKIAAALDHAHELGVVHRDLKPANIMIDEAGQPHIMDFGLARREVGEVTVTLEGHILGTPAYMSPEQAQGESHKADRRSDVYSLGVILFQLLTRELPFRGNARMLLQQVVHDEPPSPRKLNASISKDLETITLKCLEKVPSRRYQSAGELAAELRRYLAREPILARPVSRAERAVRWVRRNKMVSAVSAIAVVALVGGTVASTLFAIDARRQAAAAVARENETRAVLGFVEDKVFAAARPKGQGGGLGPNVTLHQAIEAAEPFVRQGFVQQPVIEARLRATLGLSYWYLGDVTAATKEYEIARALWSEHLGPEHPDTLIGMTRLASAYSKAGRLDEAISLHEKTCAASRRVLGPNHRETLGFINNLADAYLDAGRPKEAISLHEQTLATMRQTLDADDEYTLNVMNNLGRAYEAAGQTDKAIEIYQQMLAARQKRQGADHPDTLSAMNNLANAYDTAGRTSEALPLYEQTLAAMSKNLGANHPDTLSVMNNLAGAYDSVGRRDEALTMYEQTLAATQKELGPDHPDTLRSMHNLASAYDDAGRLDEALPLHEQSLAAMRKILGADHPYTLGAMSSLAGAYRAAGRLDKAIPLAEQALAARREKLGPDHPDTLASMNSLANAQSDAGRLDKALPLYEQTFAAMQKKRGADHPQTLKSMNNLAKAYEDAHRLNEAIPLYEQTLAARRKKLGEDHPDTLESMNNLALAWDHAGRLDEAIRLFEQTLAARRKQLGADHPDTLSSANDLAGAYFDAGRLDDSLALYEKTVAARRTKLGGEHLDTLVSMHNLATAYRAAGRLNEAISFFEQTLAARQKKQAADHPDTLNSMNNLASAYRAAGRLDEAIPLYEKTIAAMRTKLGANHRETLGAINNLAMTHQAAGRLDEAIALYEKTLATMREKLDADDPYAHNVMVNLAGAFRDARRFDEAISLYEQILSAQRKKLGDEHHETLDAMNSLAIANVAADRQEEAIRLFEQTLAAQRKALGDKHRDTLQSAHNLVAALNMFAWNLATSPSDKMRDGQRAVRFAKQACELTGYKNPGLLDTLAAAYAEDGDFDSATEWSQKALDLLGTDGEPELRKQITEALENYAAKRPTRQQTPQDTASETNDQAQTENPNKRNSSADPEKKLQAAGSK